jgi:hypothetical protein
MASVTPFNNVSTPVTNPFRGLNRRVSSNRQSARSPAAGNSPASSNSSNAGNPLALNHPESTTHWNTDPFSTSNTSTLDYQYAIRLYRQFYTNFAEINDLWQHIIENGRNISISEYLVTGFDPKSPVGILTIDNLRKSAAASALLASAISQYLINLGDKKSPPLSQADVENYELKYPIRPDSLPKRIEGALFGGKKKKASKPKKLLTPMPKKNPVKKDATKKKPVKKDDTKKKSVKKDATKKKSVKK